MDQLQVCLSFPKPSQYNGQKEQFETKLKKAGARILRGLPELQQALEARAVAGDGEQPPANTIVLLVERPVEGVRVLVAVASPMISIGPLSFCMLPL